MTIAKMLGRLTTLAVLASAGTVLAHPGHAHKILGTVTAVSTTSVDVLEAGTIKPAAQ